MWQASTPEGSSGCRTSRNHTQLCAEFKHLLTARGLPDRSDHSIQSKIVKMERAMKLAWMAMRAKGVVNLDGCDDVFKRGTLYCCPQFLALASIMTADVLQRRQKRKLDTQKEPQDRPKQVKSEPSLSAPATASAGFTPMRQAITKGSTPTRERLAASQAKSPLLRPIRMLEKTTQQSRTHRRSRFEDQMKSDPVFTTAELLLKSQQLPA